MRLGTLRLERYGPFESLSLPLDPTQGRVNLIVAPNGYGKSVIRRAIGEFLFGIDARTPMTFRFGTERMRLTAEVTHDNTTQTLVRRKGNGNTLADASGTEIAPTDANRLRGGATETVFHELFGLDTALLRSGGQDLLRSQGRLGEVLFAAGGGMGRIRDLLTDLERRRDDLGRASVRHRSRPLWAALTNWEQANTDLRKHTLRPEGWITLERAATEAAAHLETLLTEQTTETRERDRLRTIAACRPWLDRLHTAQQTLTANADAPNLDDTFEKRWRDALSDKATAAASVTHAATDLQAARDDRTKLTFDPAWIAAEADIATLADLKGQAIGAERDLPKVARDLTDAHVRAASLRRDLGWDRTFALPPEPVTKDAQRRAQQHPKLALEASSKQNDLEKAERELAATLAELEALPAQSGVATIADLAALLRAGGNPAPRLETARRKLRDAEAALRAALNAIPDCPLAEAALQTTAAPSEGRLEAAGKALNDAEAAHKTAVRDHATQQRTIAAERAKLAALERGAMLPPPEALANARTHRDALWAGFHAPDPDTSTIVALDRAIRDADAIADAIIAHGREAAEAAALRDRIQTLESDAAKQAETVTQATVIVAEARDDLLLMARTAGGNAEDMTALRAFLTARAAAIRARDTRDAAASDLAEIETNLTAIGNRLANAMAVEMPDLPALETLLAEADRRIQADHTLSAQRKALTDQAGKLRTAKATATAAAVKAEQALAGWHAQWQPLAAALARPPDEPIATTTDALTRIETLRATEQQAAKDQRRVDDMHAAIRLLAEKVANLSPLSQELAALPPSEAADGFQRRLQTEHREAARCADADRRIEQAAKKHAACLAAAETADRTLTGLRAALRAETDEDAEHQLQRARSVAAARAAHAEALRELATQGGGLSIETLTARAAETTADADAARISEIDASHQARAPLIDAARTARDAATTERDQAGTLQDAAEAAQRREAAQAALARTAEEALILHATHALLHTALERQAAGASQPLLARIGEVFRAITNGAQAGVRIEDSREGQTMVALEPDGITRKSLDQLSEGTRDQLFLALRIAALEDYAASTAPLPFIADDILQTFDDPRTEATMHALLDLSRTVQVIVLTHHTHIGALAASFPAGAVKVLRPPG